MGFQYATKFDISDFAYIMQFQYVIEYIGILIHNRILMYWKSNL